MQLRKMVVMLTALGAMSLMTACDGGETDTPGLCVSDLDCLGNEICHPDAQVCVSTCTTSDDCPASAKTCAPLASDPSVSVCQCSTTELCNQDRETADQVCSTLDKVCVQACSSNSDCGSGRTCDVLTGQCVEGSSDPCNGQCQEGETCDTTGATPTCVPAAGASCEGTAQSTCAYGLFCDAGTCAEPTAPTCGNLAGKPVLDFTPATGTGNIIYNVEKVAFGPSDDCASGLVNVVPRLFFYAKDGTLPSTEEGLQGGFYVNTSKEEQPLNPGNTFRYRRSDDGRSATVDVFLCAPDVNQVVVAFYFTGGNGYCATLTR